MPDPRVAGAERVLADYCRWTQGETVTGDWCGWAGRLAQELREVLAAVRESDGDTPAAS